MPSRKIDWTQPIELDDGTPLIAEDTGAEHTVNIRLQRDDRHSAFPILRNKGYARRYGGLVGSNHKYHVRNRKDVRVDGVRRIDLSFQVNDIVRELGSGARTEYLVVAVRGDMLDLIERIGTGRRENVYAKNFRFACHNQGAPFEDISYEPGQTLRDGYQSGLAIGLAGQFYSAGGPGGVKMTSNGGRTCRHHAEHDRIDDERLFYWKLGWKAGQARANAKKPFDKSPGAKFRVLTHDGGYLSAKMVGVGPGAYPNRVYTFEVETLDKPIVTDHFGSTGRGSYDYVVENIPVSNINIGSLVKPRDGSPAAALLGKNKKFWVVGLNVDVAELRPDGDYQGSTETKVNIADLWLVDTVSTGLRREGYAVFGAGHTSIFETLEEVSDHWWKTRNAARGTKQLDGEFIMKLTQERDNQHSSWRTINTSGPIEPLPEVVVHVGYQRVRNQAKGYVLAGVYHSESEARLHGHGVLKVTTINGTVDSVELLP